MLPWIRLETSWYGRGLVEGRVIFLMYSEYAMERRSQGKKFSEIFPCMFPHGGIPLIIRGAEVFGVILDNLPSLMRLGDLHLPYGLMTL